MSGIFAFGACTNAPDAETAETSEAKEVAATEGQSLPIDTAASTVEWIGTKVEFELKQEGDYSIVLFKHQGWKEPIEFMHHCSTKWAIFLMSLKSLVETGTGAPNPHDIKIDNWN